MLTSSWPRVRAAPSLTHKVRLSHSRLCAGFHRALEHDVMR